MTIECSYGAFYCRKAQKIRRKKMAQITEKVDVCVIGAGHAGCEAALACARMGLETVILR